MSRFPAGRDATRWMGTAGAVLFVTYVLAHPARDAASVRNSPYAVIHMLGATGMALIVIGMLSWFEQIRQRVGRFGQVAYLMAFAGSVLWVGLLFFDGFTNPVLAVYAPDLVHTDLGRTIDLYGPALIVAGLCLVLFVAGHLGLAISMARHRVVGVPTAALLAFGAGVFGTGPVVHDINPILVERIGAPLFAMGFVLLMRGPSGRSAPSADGQPRRTPVRA